MLPSNTVYCMAYPESHSLLIGRSPISCIVRYLSRKDTRLARGMAAINRQ